MMAIKVPGGEHTIEFKYSTPGLNIGLYITITAWTAWIVLILYEKKRKLYVKNEARGKERVW